MQYACVVLYCHLWRVRLYKIFPHYTKRTIFGEKLTEHKMCLFDLSETVLTLRITEPYMIKSVLRYS